LTSLVFDTGDVIPLVLWASGTPAAGGEVSRGSAP